MALRVYLAFVPREIISNNTHSTMAQGPGAIRQAWYQWKMQRFPWRKKWLVGSCPPPQS
jgi:hypothetical protein